MFSEMNQQFFNASKQAVDAAIKANSIAVDGFEKLAQAQFKALESGLGATVDFFGEIKDARDIDGVKATWPKGVQLAKDSAELSYHTAQEVIGISFRTAEQLAQLVKSGVEVEVANKARVAKTAAAK